MSQRMKQDLKRYAMVGIGGMIGAVGRYSMSLMLSETTGFPYATLLTNLIGCFLLSFILHHHVIKRVFSPDLFAALTIGVIGSFTTFSTVAVDVVLWFTHPSIAVSYVLLTIFGCLLLSFCGFKVATRKFGDI